MHPIGLASKKSGVSIETIRYYEREGVVPDAPRTESGRRLYSEEAITRLRFVRRCRDLGFSIPDIKALLALSEREEPPCKEARTIGQNTLSQVRRKIGDLQRMEDALSTLVGRCEPRKPDCPILQELFAD